MHIRETFSKFFADRGTHLAAMIAYFALLSFVPLIFLALALLGLGGRTTESSYFVEELQKVFPSASVSSIVNGVDKIRRNATSLGLIGAAFLLWSSLSLFSVLESAFNIVYDRPNRSFLHGKARATLFMLVGLVTLFVGLLVGGVGAHTLDRFAPGFLGEHVRRARCLGGRLVDRHLPLPDLRLPVPDQRRPDARARCYRERSSRPSRWRRHSRSSRSSWASPSTTSRLQVIGGPLLLLIWLYVMANVIVFGAEINWSRSRSPAQPAAPPPPGRGAS